MLSTWLMTTLAGVPNGVEDFAREIRFSSRKSFGCKILVSNSFGYKILRGDIFSVRLFSIFCRGDGGGGYMAARRIVDISYLPPQIASSKGLLANFLDVSR